MLTHMIGAVLDTIERDQAEAILVCPRRGLLSRHLEPRLQRLLVDGQPPAAGRCLEGLEAASCTRGVGIK